MSMLCKKIQRDKRSQKITKNRHEFFSYLEAKLNLMEKLKNALKL